MELPAFAEVSNAFQNNRLKVVEMLYTVKKCDGDPRVAPHPLSHVSSSLPQLKTNSINSSHGFSSIYCESSDVSPDDVPRCLIMELPSFTEVSNAFQNNRLRVVQSTSLLFKRKIRTRLDLLSIPQSGGKNVKTFRWDHRLQIQSLFMALKRVPLW